MIDEELVRKAAKINYEIVITHGLSDAGVGFEWQGLFIHDPFTDPQYGAFPVNPAEQYGAAYLESVFVTDPATAFQMAQQQLREKASKDLSRYCIEHELEAAVVIAIACGARVTESGSCLEMLTDEQVASLWAHVDEAANTSDESQG
jgi:hypothetical protein